MTSGVGRENIIERALAKVGQFSPYNGPNCFAAAFGEFDIQMSSEEALFLLASEWQKTSKIDLKPGDLVRFGTTHMALYLGDGMAFHKPNWQKTSPYSLLPLDGIIAEAELFHRATVNGRAESQQVVDMIASSAIYYTPRVEPALFLNAESLPIEGMDSLLQYGILRFADAAGVGQFAGADAKLFRGMVLLIPFYNAITRMFGDADVGSLSKYPVEVARAYVHFKSLAKQLHSMMNEFGRLEENIGVIDFIIDGFKNPPEAVRNDISALLSVMGVPVKDLERAVQKVERKLRWENGGFWKWFSDTFRPHAIHDLLTPAMQVALSYAGDVPIKPVPDARVIEPVDLIGGSKMVADLLGGASVDAAKMSAYSLDMLFRAERDLILDHEALGSGVFPRVEKIRAAIERSKAALKVREKIL